MTLSWQPRLCRLSPWQGRPPNLAGGLLHSLVLTDTPSQPSHSDQPDHRLHEPWTDGERGRGGESERETRREWERDGKRVGGNKETKEGERPESTSGVREGEEQKGKVGERKCETGGGKEGRIHVITLTTYYNVVYL